MSKNLLRNSKKIMVAGITSAMLFAPILGDVLSAQAAEAPRDEVTVVNASASYQGKKASSIWVKNDIYIFNQSQYIYYSPYLRIATGTVKKGAQKKITSFVVNGKTTYGKLSTGGYVTVVKANNEITVNVYGTVDCDALNVRSSHSANSKKVGVVYYGRNLKFTREQDGFGYAPEIGGWVCLKYIRG